MNLEEQIKAKRKELQEAVNETYSLLAGHRMWFDRLGEIAGDKLSGKFTFTPAEEKEAVKKFSETWKKLAIGFEKEDIIKKQISELEVNYLNS